MKDARNRVLDALGNGLFSKGFFESFQDIRTVSLLADAPIF